MTTKHSPAQPSVPTPKYEYSADGKTVTFKNAGECLQAAQASDEPMRAAKLPTKDSELLPCPFCGTDDVRVYLNASSDRMSDWDHHAECNSCGAMGQRCKDEPDAAAAWNRRAALKTQPAPTEAPVAWMAESCIGNGMRAVTKFALDEASIDRYVSAEQASFAGCERTKVALYRKPAPTEAQGMTNAERVQALNPFKFVPWSKEAEMIEGWTKTEKAREEAQAAITYTVDDEVMSPLEYIDYLHGQIKAQGEDSARLADGYKSGMVGGNASEGKLVLHYHSHEQAEAAASVVFGMIDRARASAEAGGVKS